jgi:hypothetical protein
MWDTGCGMVYILHDFGCHLMVMGRDHVWFCQYLLKQLLAFWARKLARINRIFGIEPSKINLFHPVYCLFGSGSSGLGFRRLLVGNLIGVEGNWQA